MRSDTWSYVRRHANPKTNEMQTDIITNIQGGQLNPFQRTTSEHVNAGTVEIESSRAIAEAQGKLVIAKRFPRDEARAYAKIIESCKRKGLADEATYSFERGKEVISGPSIRLAEELARAWGNIDYGIRELSRKDGVSEMEAYAWDLETNTSSSQKFSVRHWRDTRSGGYAIKDERDIYELTANQGARRLRARILAILPPDIVESALCQCRATLAGNAEEPIADRVRRLVQAFGKYGVTAAMIEARLGHSLDATLPDEIADLRGVYNSIKQGMSKARDWFGNARGEAEAAEDILDGAPAPEPEPTQQAPAETTAEPARRRRQAPRQESPAQAPAPAPSPEPVQTQEKEPADDTSVFD